MLCGIFAKTEIYMRFMLVSLALTVLAACSGAKTGQEAPAESGSEIAADANENAGSEPTIEDMRAQSLAEIDQEACAASGGVVRQEGMLGLYRCVKPFADAGKACRSKSDCEGKCLATDDAMPDQEVVGACQAEDSPFGCYAEVEDGKIQAAICVD